VWLCNMETKTMQDSANYGGLPGDEDPNPGPGGDEPTGDGSDE